MHGRTAATPEAWLSENFFFYCQWKVSTDWML